MKVGDLVYYAPCLPRERVMGIIVGTHDSGDQYGHKLTLWHVMWLGEGAGRLTHEPTATLQGVENVDKE